MPFSSVLGASSVIKPGVVTSTTRPSAPYEGQVIFETDTDKTMVWNGSSWKELVGQLTSYTPTWSNLTVGNATQDWAYQIVGDIVTVTGSITFGSTTAMGTNPYMTLPITAYSGAVQLRGFAALGDSGTATYIASPISVDTVGVYYFCTLTNGTFASEGVTTATVPFTWTTNDFIRATLIYRKA